MVFCFFEWDVWYICLFVLLLFHYCFVCCFFIWFGDEWLGRGCLFVLLLECLSLLVVVYGCWSVVCVCVNSVAGFYNSSLCVWLFRWLVWCFVVFVLCCWFVDVELVVFVSLDWYVITACGWFLYCFSVIVFLGGCLLAFVGLMWLFDVCVCLIAFLFWCSWFGCDFGLCGFV